MSMNDQDLEALEKLRNILQENNFEVEGVDRLFGFDNVDYDTENEEEILLGHETKIDISVRKKHYSAD